MTCDACGATASRGNYTTWSAPVILCLYLCNDCEERLRALAADDSLIRTVLQYLDGARDND